MEKRGVTDYVNMRVRRNIFPQTLHGELSRLRLTYIEGNLLLHTLPVVRYRIVHMHRVPHNIGKETHRIIMERLRARNHHVAGFLFVMPLFFRDKLSLSAAAASPLCRHHIPSSTVNDFPPFLNIVSGIHGKHIRI